MVVVVVVVVVAPIDVTRNNSSPVAESFIQAHLPTLTVAIIPDRKIFYNKLSMQYSMNFHLRTIDILG